MEGKIYNEAFSLKDEGGIFLQILIPTCLITIQYHVTTKNIIYKHEPVIAAGFLFCVQDLHTIMPVLII
jgi:hypothetical protein